MADNHNNPQPQVVAVDGGDNLSEAHRKAFELTRDKLAASIRMLKEDVENFNLNNPFVQETFGSIRVLHQKIEEFLVSGRASSAESFGQWCDAMLADLHKNFTTLLLARIRH